MDGGRRPDHAAVIIGMCAAAAGTTVTLKAVPFRRGPLVRVPERWPTLARDPAPARAAGLPSTPLSTTIADISASFNV